MADAEAADDTTGNDDEPKTIRLKDIHYGVESFYAIVKPVFLTMLISALAVVYVTTSEFAAAQSAGLANVYTVRQSEAGDSTGQKLGDSLLNGIIIVSVICTITFLIVLLYKYRCMKLLVGYMILSSVMLLGFLGGLMLFVAMERYNINIDAFSYYFLLWNFAVVGSASIFYGRGFAPAFTQAYLIITSVIVAWQLSFFDDWTAWVLLVLLALYDLFAVLTPCGPLKALVKLMQRDNAPEMPGLLYEAQLPVSARRRRRENYNENNTNGTNGNATAETETGQARTENTREGPVDLDEHEPENVEGVENNDTEQTVDDATRNAPALRVPPVTASRTESATEGALPTTNNSTSVQPESSTVDRPSSSTARVNQARDTESTGSQTEPISEASLPETSSPPVPPTATVPLALARVYRLQLLDDPTPPWCRQSSNAAADNSNDIDDDDTVYTPEKLRSMVVVVFPVGGGSIQVENPNAPSSMDTRYKIIDRNGTLKRELFVNEEGRIFEYTERQASNGSNDNKGDNSIKLGLGDFIFYSILVSKAASFSFTTFAVCTLAILTGLGLTLFLLSVYGQALPALPISIFLGVTFFLITRYVIQPWVHAVFEEEVFV